MRDIDYFPCELLFGLLFSLIILKQSQPEESSFVVLAFFKNPRGADIVAKMCLQVSIHYYEVSFDRTKMNLVFIDDFVAEVIRLLIFNSIFFK